MLAASATFTADYYGVTTVHPVGLAALCVCGVTLFFLPRRYAAVMFLAMACFIPPAQRLALVTLDFNFTRIMVLFGWARVLSRKEHAGYRWNTVDWVMLAYTVVNTVVYSLQYASAAAVINRLGASFDTVGMYFLFRILIRSFGDLLQLLRGAVWLAVPVVLALCVEKMTGRNVFAVFGGVPEYTLVREGSLRVQGAFAHPIVAGCFWASFIPLMGALWFQGGRDRWLAVTGVGLSMAVVVLCASSTPLLAVVAGAVGMMMYRVKDHMRLLRWGGLACLLGLHLVMIAPVWHLIARVSAVGGNSGWHRFVLIDGFIRHFDEWWLLGTQSTAHWGHYANDVANQYVLEGVRGGIWSFALFITAISLAFGRVGRLWRSTPPGADRWLAWSLGVSLFVHCVIFIGLSYFGQITMLWYLCLAAASGVVVTPVVATSPSSLAVRGARTRQLPRLRPVPVS